MNWLRKRFRKWLGIEKNYSDISELNRLYSDLTNIGVDVHFKSPHMILIFSQINGGQLRHIEAYFESLQELNELATYLKERYRPKNVFWDVPPHTRELFRI